MAKKQKANKPTGDSRMWLDRYHDYERRCVEADKLPKGPERDQRFSELHANYDALMAEPDAPKPPPDDPLLDKIAGATAEWALGGKKPPDHWFSSMTSAERRGTLSELSIELECERIYGTPPREGVMRRDDVRLLKHHALERFGGSQLDAALLERIFGALLAEHGIDHKAGLRMKVAEAAERLARVPEKPEPASSWDPHKSKRQVFEDWCDDLGLKPESLEHVRDASWEEREQEAKKLLDAEGRFFASARQKPTDDGVVGRIALRLGPFCLNEPHAEKLRALLVEKSGIAELNPDRLAAYLLRVFDRRGWTPERVEQTNFADLIVYLDESQQPDDHESAKRLYDSNAAHGETGIGNGVDVEQLAEAVASKVTATATIARKSKRGGKQTSDPAEDRRIAEAWGTGQYQGYKHLAATLGNAWTYKKVQAAIDRHRKRQSNRTEGNDDQPEKLFDPGRNY